MAGSNPEVMRILYLVHRLPFPPDKGDKIRSFHWLEALRRHHEVHVVTLMDDPDDAQYIGELETRCASVTVTPVKKLPARMRALVALMHGGSLSVAMFQERAAHAAAAAVLEEHDIDLIFEFSAAMAEYPVSALGIPRVLDMVDVDSRKFQGYGELSGHAKKRLFALEAKRLSEFEKRCVETHDLTLLCTRQEAALLEEVAPDGHIDHVQNGVVLPDSPPPCGSRPHLVFVGAMDYHANADAVTWCARYIMPAVLKTHPEARFLIVGRNPTRQVRALSALPGVEVHADAPDVGVFLEGASAGLIPLRVAQGIQNKVLEAMAWRLPVITHPKVGAALHATPGCDMLVAETVKGYTDHIRFLLDEHDFAREMGDAGRRLVETSFAWEASYDRLEALIQNVVKGTSK